MPEETTTVEPTLSEAVQKITIDNREIPITEAPEVFRNMESSLRADVTKKYQEVKQEKEKNAANLKADIEWFNTHDRRIWNLYTPKVEGGQGFIGTDSQLTQYDNESDDDIEPTPVKTTSKRAFEQDPQIKVLRDKVAELEAKQMQIENETFQTGTERVLSAKEVCMRKYPNASEKLVVDKLGDFFNTNRRHPSNLEVENIVKIIHDEITKIASRQSKGTVQTGIPTKPITATPEATTKPTDVDKKKKVLRLEQDSDRLVKTIFGRLSGGT